MNDPIIGTLLGSYEIQKRLGRGGMGVVYLGRHVSLDRLVAIKTLLPEFCANMEFVERFLREARAAAHLNHPNIVQIYDANVHENVYFFVMEYIEGKDLAHLLREKGQLEETEALKLVRQAASGLAFAHSQGVVHRDIKPENLLLTNDGVVKIGDLGLAKWKPNESEMSLTVSGTMMGTPYYISPEQIHALKDIDGRADVYSLGMTLYHILAGQPAFSKGTAASIMAQHLTEEPPPIEQFNAHLSEPTLALIGGMIAKERDERVGSMEVVTAGIGEILDASRGKAPAARPASFKLTARRRKFSRRWLYALGAAVAAAVLLLLVVLAAVFNQSRNQPSSEENGAPPAEPAATEGVPTENAAEPKPPASEETAAAPPPSETVPAETRVPKPAPARPPSSSGGTGKIAATVENLIATVDAGDTAALRALLDRGVDVNAASDKGITALMAAAKQGQATMVQLLLTKGARLEERDGEGLTALTHAASEGHNAIVKALITKGADVNAKDEKGGTALTRAMENQHLDIAKTLSAHEADVNLKDKEGNTPLITAAALGRANFVKLLLECGANVDEKNREGNTALMCAGNAEIAKLLLEKSADVNETNKEGMTALICATAAQRSDVINALVDSGVNVDQKDKNGGTALMWASAMAQGAPEVIQTLLNRGASLKARNNWETTPLISAAAYGEGKNSDAVKLLLEKGADINDKDGGGSTPLMHAAAMNYKEVAQLLKDAGAKLDFFSAAALGDAATVKALLSRGADVQAKHLDGQTALMVAAANGHIEIVRMLIEKKADLNAHTEQGKTALAIATEKGLAEIVELLKKSGARE